MPEVNLQQVKGQTNLSKWKDQRYSRVERGRRKLETSATEQHKITEFYPILNEVEILLKKNKQLQQELHDALFGNKIMESAEKEKVTSHFLKTLYKTALSNANKKKGGHRYGNDEDGLKDFASYLFVITGKKSYETLYSNLQDAFPSITTVARHIKSSVDTIKEGEFRFSALKKFLVEGGYPLTVWLSEDATRILGRPQFDEKNNIIVGLVPPLNEKGLPEIFAFPATTAAVIESYFQEYEVAGYAYAILAQPLMDNAPAFCLCLFGTDNKFTSQDIMRRWEWIVDEAAKEGIQVVGFSADGDPKLLKSMNVKCFSRPTAQNLWSNWFLGNLEATHFCFQDFVHIATKLRTRLLKPSVVLPMGKYFVSPSHILELLSTVNKSFHGVSSSDLDTTDKMNYRSMEKIWSARVTELLSQKVPESQATVIYLDLSRTMVTSFTSKSLSPLERVAGVWKMVFFLRCWIYWLQQNNFSPTENFITSNTYHCIEVDAHNLLLILRFFRANQMDALFLPFLMSSQTCEEFFRTARSMTSTESTVVNFTLLEFLYRTRRIDLQTFVKHKLNQSYCFPRNKRATALADEGPSEPFVLPRDDEIQKVVETALCEALALCRSLGMIIPNYAKVHEHIALKLNRTTELKEDIGVDDDEDCELESEREDATDGEASSSKEDSFSDSLDSGEVFENGTLDNANTDNRRKNLYVEIKDESGNVTRIKKTTFIWQLDVKRNNLSSDRIQRVKNKVNGKAAANKEWLPTDVCSREETISVTDWCAFKFKSQSKFLIGRVLSFSYLTGRNRSFSLPSAPVKTPEGVKGRGLGCLCDWYTLNRGGKISKCSLNNVTHYDIENYICTLARPKLQSSEIIFDAAVYRLIANMMNKY